MSVLIHLIVSAIIFFIIMLPVYRTLGLSDDSFDLNIPTYKISIVSMILAMISVIYILYLFLERKYPELIMIGIAAFYVFVGPFISLLHEKINRKNQKRTLI